MRGSREDDNSANLDDVERRLRDIRDNPEKSTTLRALAQYQLERIAGIRAMAGGSGEDGTPTVTVERMGPFTFSAIPDTSLVAVAVGRRNSAPLVAVVSAEEIRRLTPLFEQVRERVERGQAVEIDVRAAFLDLLGRDPFDGQFEDG
ncbi:hypothetical protein I0C86_19965 [Plantactinospora sp. S1510]|uniref:Uncharacterized protein n=1 Tax=Plantactinospora alkalitolerans TaxID=2789879 RepID=A0ABS0GYG0_9ACTN|nr:hypothetical protein [Plantactinospora alkalitolerans]MBF9131220.1 hypothetical protein [Plantactinospora alkalitolerans]